jgi:MFS family permease
MLSTFALGAIAAAFVGRLVMSTDWRLMFLIGSTSAFVSIYIWFAIPADKPMAMKTEAKGPENKIGLRDILIGDAGKRLAMATLLNVFIMGGYWGAATWIPTFLHKERELSLVMMTNFSMFMYVGMFFGYQFFGYLGDRIGRKKAMMAALSVCVVSIPVYIFVQNSIFLFWWGTVVGFGYGGPFGLCGALFAELFPENIRALAGGFCWNVGRIGAVLAPFTIGVLGKTYGLSMALVIASCMSVLGLFVLMFLPEAVSASKSR